MRKTGVLCWKSALAAQEVELVLDLKNFICSSPVLLALG